MKLMSNKNTPPVQYSCLLELVERRLTAPIHLMYFSTSVAICCHELKGVTHNILQCKNQENKIHDVVKIRKKIKKIFLYEDQSFKRQVFHQDVVNYWLH